MFSSVLKFILGIFLAIAILGGSGLATALYFINRTATQPAKPVFSNDNPAKSPKVTEAKAKTTSKPESSAKPTPTESPKTQESPKPLPPGAYRGVVTWPQGLGLRAEPQQEAARVGGVGFKQKVIILEESSDKAWQKIRLESGEQEGWVKAGNTERSDEQDAAPQPKKPDQ
ncbi:SH3 domain-containing protein [Calothrix sp. PCC 7507]|uniref:SH3 domain-containing protein n=1 Tax=Calothrix sp. PCC 7507 TaxID=99598 RepID=UPI00029ED50B|nr:SH3 domain-containing protein [Calothrix sp. PCC 7507]AFY33757.1 SH3 type 3 domain-containing protein [Calothrix sp. PCC 7507]